MTRTTDPLFDRRIADWLEGDPRRAPGQVLETVLAALPSVPQRRSVRSPWGFASRVALTRLAAAAVMAAIAVGGAFLLTHRGQPAVVGSPSQSPATASASAVSSPSVIPSRTPGWTITGSMLTPRSGHTATLLANGQVLVAGGQNGNDALASAELFDAATGTWTATGSMPQPGADQLAVRLRDGRVLVVGVDGRSSGTDPQASAELYDPAAGTWAATGRPVASHRSGTATLLRDGRVLATGGGASAELYDPATGVWTATGSMGTARYWPQATLLTDGRVLVMGGSDCACAGGRWLASAELYDLTTGTWSYTWTMTGGEATATLLADGRVFTTLGGFDPRSSASIISAEVYDPRSGWYAAGTGSAQQTAQWATVLPDGRVLVLGSKVASNAVLGPAATLFDPATGSWAAAGRPTRQRDSFTATLLADGRVLVAGGWSEPAPSATAPAGLAWAELFTP